MPRERKSTSTTRKGNTVDMEVAALFKMGNRVNQSSLIALRKKYGDTVLTDKIQAVFMERHRVVVKGSKKFAEAVRTKYANSNVPYHQLLMKARLHAKKLGLSEAEFAEFQRIYEQELSGTGRANEVVLPLTNMMKVLGNITGSGSTDGFSVGSGDYRNLQEIIRLYEASKPLHSQVVLQSLQYESFDKTAMNGQIDVSRHNPGEHVHPVIASMFLPKIDIFDEHFLFANIAGIVNCLYNKKPIRTRPDYELYYNLVTDPNDIVCDERSPVADLLQRCNLQNQLWNAVLHLRNGQFYNSSFREFMTAVDVCRLNKHDNPDLVYGRHDGTILKRILSAFSFRPTVIATAPIANVFATNPYAQNIRPTVTAIPMINIRLLTLQQNLMSQTLTVQDGQLGPQQNTNPNDDGFLAGALQQTMTFIEGNMLVNRATKVIYSREALIFYIDRRANIIPYGMKLFNLARLPSAVAGFERITETPLSVPLRLDVGQGNDAFVLTSGVLAETRTDTSNNGGTNTSNNGSNVRLVTGSTAFFNVHKVGDHYDNTRMGLRPSDDNSDYLNSAYLPAQKSPPRKTDYALPLPEKNNLQQLNNKYTQDGGATDLDNVGFMQYDPMNAIRQNDKYPLVKLNNKNDTISKRAVVLVYTAPKQQKNSSHQFVF